MKVAVYDTYVAKKDGQLMHFDVIVPTDVAADRVLEFGRAYLKEAGQEGQPLSARECRFCHVEEASAPIAESIRETGYYIEKMEGCE